jgi:hypothetical protein
MQSHDLNHAALFNYKKGVALRIGKTEEYVRRECHPTEDGTVRDRYGRFKQLFLAVLAEHPLGADLYLEDLIATREAHRRPVTLTPAEWERALDEAIKETSEGIRAAVQNHDPARTSVEVSEGISRLRRLLAITHEAARLEPSNMLNID